MKTRAYGIKAEAEDLDHVRLSMVVNKSAMEHMPDLSKPVEVEIRTIRRKRSLNANAFLWSLCGKIAQAVGTTKEEVYRQAIHDAGKWDIYSGSEKALQSLAEAWNTSGIGYQSEMLSSGALMLFYGSSSYNTQEMSRLIDWVVSEAEDQGIDASTPQERALLLKDWGKEHG